MYAEHRAQHTGWPSISSKLYNNNQHNTLVTRSLNTMYAFIHFDIAAGTRALSTPETETSVLHFLHSSTNSTFVFSMEMLLPNKCTVHIFSFVWRASGIIFAAAAAAAVVVDTNL